MGKIIKCEIKVKNTRENRYLTKDDIILNVLLSLKRTGNPQWNQFTLPDILQMLDCKTSIKLNNMEKEFQPNVFCNPGLGNDFPWCISIALRLGYYYNVLSYDEYTEYVKYHYNQYYKTAYLSTRKMCQTFYERYFSERCKKKYSTLDALFEKYSKEISEKGTAVFIKRGGDFSGCYEDDIGRKRPITTPIYYERIIPDTEKLWICFIERLMLD